MLSGVQKIVRGKSAADIVECVESAVRDGRLEPGRLLPSVREMARFLGLSPATVASAYQTLQNRAVVISQGRRGTRISHRPIHRSLLPMTLPPGVRNLYDGNPDPALLPPLAPMLATIDPKPLLYGEPSVDPDLIRLVKADLLEEGVASGTIAVVNGALDAIERVLAEHLRPGDRVAVEDPGYGNIFDLVMSLGLSIVPLAMDESGILPEALERAGREGAKAAIITPRAQNPTGSCLSSVRARELGNVLRRFPDLLVIEDDHMNLVSGVPLYSLSDAARSRWAYVRSFAKSLNPDLRVAVVTGDDQTLARVEDRMIMGRRWVSHILQRIVSAMLADRSVRSHLSGVAARYTSRRKAIQSALLERGIDVSSPSGFNVWVPVPEETPAVQSLSSSGWAVRAGERFRINAPPAIRITVAALQESEAALLAQAVRSALNGVVGTAGA